MNPYLFDKNIAASAIASNYCDRTPGITEASKRKLIKVLVALETIRPKIDLLQLAVSSDVGAIAKPIINRLGVEAASTITSFAIANERYQLKNNSWVNNSYSTHRFPKSTNKEMFFSILDLGGSLGFFGDMSGTNRYGLHPAWVRNQTYVDIGDKRFEATIPGVKNCRVITLNVTQTRFDVYTDKTSSMNGIPPTIPTANPYNISAIRPQTVDFKGYVFGSALSDREVEILVDALSLW